LKFYNATAMVENIDYGFIQYMIEKNETYHLAPGMSFLKEMSPNTKHRSNYGLPPTPAVINHINNSSVIYTKEMFIKERDETGKISKEKLGVTRILDPMLLKEMIGFNKNEGNFDRVRAFGLALAYAKQLDATIPLVKVDVTEEQKKTVRMNSPFMLGGASGFAGKSVNSSPFMMRK
jgi:hypothetical protein